MSKKNKRPKPATWVDQARKKVERAQNELGCGADPAELARLKGSIDELIESLMDLREGWMAILDHVREDELRAILKGEDPHEWAR